MGENLHQLSELIDKYSIRLDENQRTTRIKLNHQERIEFAFKYYSLMPISLIETLKLAKENEEFHKKTIYFISKNNLLKPYPNTCHEYCQNYDVSLLFHPHLKNSNYNTLIQLYNFQNWLEPFDEEAMFDESKTKHPAFHKFAMPNGEFMVFDKAKTTQIKLAILNEGITPARCIVEGAYQPVANGTFSSYIKSLKK